MDGGPLSTKRKRPTTRRSQPRRTAWLTITFGGVVLVAVGLLGFAAATGPLADARHTVVTVNGSTVDRTALRGRMTLDAELQAGREAVLRTAASAGLLTPEDQASLSLTVEEGSADPLRMAIDGLVKDVLIRAAAETAGLTDETDLDAELAHAVGADFDRRVRVVTIAQPYGDPSSPSGDWPPPVRATDDRPAVAAAQAQAVDRAAVAIDAGTPVADVIAGLRLAGWRVGGGDRWLPASGPVEGLSDAAVAVARRGTAEDAAVAVEDPLTGGGAVIQILPDALPAGATVALVDRSTIDGSTFQAWASARAAERALREHFASGWMSQLSGRVRVAELVVGPADVEGPPGPYRSFAHVVVKQLAVPERRDGETDDALAARLTAELAVLPDADRVARFRALVDAANRGPADDPLARSGEIGYFTHDQLLPALADPAFDAAIAVDDVIGPVTTVVGPELFLLRGRFDGVLDERSNAALVEARTTDDLTALARRISPTGEAGRADGTLWRANAETVGDPAIRHAYAETPIGGRSEPIVIDGEIVVVEPLERVTGQLGSAERDRLRVRGFDTWLTGAIAAASIERDTEPLPGILVASPSPSASIDNAPTAEPPDGRSDAPTTGPTLFPIPTPAVIP